MKHIKDIARLILPSASVYFSTAFNNNNMKISDDLTNISNNIGNINQSQITNSVITSNNIVCINQLQITNNAITSNR